MQTQSHHGAYRGPRKSEEFNFFQLEIINDCQRLFKEYNESLEEVTLTSNPIYRNNIEVNPTTLIERPESLMSLINQISTATEIARNNIFGFIS